MIDYLLKPISFERFNKAVNKILDNRIYTQAAVEKDPIPSDHIFVRCNNKYFKVNFSEIIFVQSMRDYLKINTGDYKLITHQTMAYFEKTLPANKFIRVHKSFIVAIAHIRSIYGNSIEIGTATIPIGNSYKDAVMDLVVRR